jgi:hypothetical protein
MYIYNDWEPYGLQELVDNLVGIRIECSEFALIGDYSCSISLRI